MPTQRSNSRSDPVEILLAGKVPPFSKEAHSAALGLYYFGDRGELPEATLAHLRRVLDRWRPEIAVAGGSDA
jgi:hypothetical protein